MIISAIIASIVCLYIILIGSFAFGLWRINPEEPETDNQQPIVVLIPFRNEELNLADCIQSLLKQNYPVKQTRFIFINDHSYDNSCFTVKKYAAMDQRIQLIHNTTNEQGKKAALANGIKNSNEELIVCTDADCITNKNWLATLNHYFQSKNSDLLIAPVFLIRKKGLLNYFQYLEQISLTLSSAGSAALSKPIMSNGANIAFRRSKLIQYSNPFNTKVSSGDDIFLLQKFKADQKSIHFVAHPDAIVRTDAQPTIQTFWNQRKRWAGKSTAYTDILTVFTASFVFLCNLGILSAFVLCCLQIISWNNILDFLMVKTVIDLALILSGGALIKRKWKLIPGFIIFQPIYILYVSVIAPFAIFGSFEWKGRRLRK